MITRDEFKKIAKDWHATDDLSADDSPLWVMEKHHNLQPGWFVCIKPISLVGGAEFRFWCKQCLLGEVLCYSSDADNQEEWWGFTNKDDVMLWLLRWGS